MYVDSPKAKRIEFRAPDPTCNPYLAFAAMLMAGIDGVANKIEPDNPPLDKNTYELSAPRAAPHPHRAGLAGRGPRRPASATTPTCSRAACSRRT